MMKKLLVVDDEEAVRTTLARALGSGPGAFLVRAAGSGREALDLLAREDVDLVVTDLRMPEMDGLELIAVLRREHPGLPVIVASGRANAAEEAVKVGSVDCFIKPFSVDSLRRRATEILAESVKGRVENINLASFLQLLEIEHKSCSLRVESPGREGQLYFSAGRLIHAVTGDLTGAEAAFEIVTWEDTDIEISGAPRLRETTIDLPLSFLLMEAMRLHDEAERSAPHPGRDFSAVLARAAELDGLVAALVAAEGTGEVLGVLGDLDEEACAAMAQECAMLLQSQRRIVAGLGGGEEPGALEEILVTCAGRYAILRPIEPGGEAFLIAVLEREPMTPGLARLALAAIAAGTAGTAG